MRIRAAGEGVEGAEGDQQARACLSRRKIGRWADHDVRVVGRVPMREFRGDGGREAANNKADPEFRVDWKGSSERENNMRTDRKDAREHRGGGGGGAGEVRELLFGGRRSGGDITGSIRERKSSDDSRLSNSAQETGEVREGWGSRIFLKSSSSNSQAAGAAAVATGMLGGEEEGEIGEFTDDGGGCGVAAAPGGAAAGGEATTATRFEETKRKRDERGEPRGVTHNSNSCNVAEREERPRGECERRGGGELQVHIAFVPPSQHVHREKEQREEKAVEREKEKESNNNSNSKQQQKDSKVKEEDSPASLKDKCSSISKESEVVDIRKEKEDGEGGNRRKEAGGDQEEKQQQQVPTQAERAEKKGGGPGSMVVDFEHESGAGTSAGGCGKNIQQQEENSSKIVGETDAKERTVETREPQQQQQAKGKVESLEDAKEKGKRKLRDYDRAGDGGDDMNNADGEDYEREVVSNYGIQRKRLLRPRGHYQGSNTREVRPRFRVKDPEGYPVRPAATTIAVEISTLVYRAGEGLQEELRRVRKEFEDRNGKLTAEQQEDRGALEAAAPTIEVRIPAELTTTSNRQVQGSQLWGTDIYTDDSDLVAILMHTGYYSPTSSSSAHTILELRPTVRVVAPQERYTSSLRNSLRSRAWGAASGCAFSVDSCYLVKKDGGKVQLEPRLTFTPAFAPTIAPAVTERTVTTRAVSMSAYRAQRFVQEVTIQYNLCNEPWLKYSMNIVADKGLKKSQFTSARLKKTDVLYVETHSHRYELSYEDIKTGAVPVETKPALEKGKEKAEIADKGFEKGVEKGQMQGGSSKEVFIAGSNHNNGSVVGDKYRWALCKCPLSLQAMRTTGVPLPMEYVKVLDSGLGWEEVQWSPAGVCVRGKQYSLARAHFVPLHE